MNATLTNIRREYYWIGMCDEVRLYTKSCDNCQKLAAVNTYQNRLLQPIPPPERPWQHIGVDLVCDLPISKDGYLHLLVAVCYLSKYVVARPLKSKRSSEVINRLRNIYLTLGTPQIIQHDQGPEFRSKEFQQFHKELKVENRSTAAYRPQSNGLVESHNKILKNKLEKFRSNMDVEWPDRIHEACLAANTHLKKATKTTPFRLMFGRDLILRTFFGSNIEESDNVLIRNVKKDKKLPGTKTQPKYLGPYEVHKVTKGHVIVTDKMKSKKVPFHLTKKYLQRNTQSDKAPTEMSIRVSRKRKSSMPKQLFSKSGTSHNSTNFQRE